MSSIYILFSPSKYLSQKGECSGIKILKILEFRQMDKHTDELMDGKNKIIICLKKFSGASEVFLNRN